MNKTFFSFSFGCRVNQAEKEEIDRKLISKGYIFTDNVPDIFILNSCAVTQKAEREVRQKIYQVRKKFPKTKIILTGCAATYWIHNKLSFQNPDIIGMSGIYKDKNIIFIPNSQKDQIPQILLNLVETQINISLPIGNNRRIDRHKSPFYSKYLSSGRLLVKIQDGCNRCCSYCIVPYLRGKPKSQKIENIINKINSYFCDTKSTIPKIHEVILTAVNTEAFGQDTGESFLDLIKRILNDTKIEKISFGSIHPLSITDEFLDFYQKLTNSRNADRVVPYFHIPIQSGSNKILKLMKRGYSVEEMQEMLNLLHHINPKALIATDIIVGFPGETDQDFEETVKFIKKSSIKKLHVFRFSVRERTKASRLLKNHPHISNQIKIQRIDKLLSSPPILFF